MRTSAPARFSHLGRQLLLLLTLLGLLEAGSAATPAKPYVVGAEDAWYPYSARRDEQAQGMSVDLVRAAFAASGIEIQFQTYPYARCMQMVERGQLPACFNTTVDQTIRARFQLSREPLFTDDIVLWAHKDSGRSAKRLEQLDGLRVGVVNGYEYGPAFDERKAIERVPVRRDINVFEMLVRDRIDYGLAFRGTAEALFRQHPELSDQVIPLAVLASPNLFLSFSRQNVDADWLRSHFDDGMQTIRANGKYQQIVDSWHRRLALSGTPTP